LGNPPPQKTLVGSDHDEQNLQRLKNEAIQFNDTALSVALQQSANAVKTNVMHLDDSAANELMEALNSREQRQSRELPGGERGGNA